MINIYNESDLHKSIKEFYCPSNGCMEVPLLGSICDILYDKNKIIEIQTSNISALRLKLDKFLPEYKLKIVYPIIVNAYNLVLDEEGNIMHRRKSPKHGTFFQLFTELSGIYYLIDNKNLSFEILYTDCEIIKQYGVNFRKNKHHKNRPSVINKRLLKILKTENYATMKDVCNTVLNLLPNEFTSKDLKNRNSGKYTSYTIWFLKKAGLIYANGKKDRCVLYKKI